MSTESASHIVLLRRVPEPGEVPRWTVLNYANSLAEAGRIAHKPTTEDGEAVELVLGDLIAIGPFEIVSPEILESESILYIMTEERVRTATTPRERNAELGRGSWLGFWEGASADPVAMFGRAGRVDARRLAFAATAAVESVLPLYDSVDPRPRSAVETAKSWLLGKGKLSALNKAADIATDARYARRGDDVSNAVTSAAYRLVEGVIALSSEYPAFFELLGAVERSLEAHFPVGMPDYSSMASQELASSIREHIPLHVVALADFGIKLPFVTSRENPRRAGRR